MWQTANLIETEKYADEGQQTSGLLFVRFVPVNSAQ